MEEGETEPMEVENAPTPGGSTKCGAKTRRGKPCQSPPVRGKRRCRMHAGAPGSGAPFGRRNGNYRHGHPLRLDMQNSSQGVGATARRRAGAIARRPPPKPRGGPSALAGERSEPIWLGVRDHTHALFARKVQRKLSNGVAGLAAAGSSLDRQKSRQFLPSQRRRLMTNVCASTSAKSRPELRIPTAAAQTRVVSGGEVWPIQRELSRHLKYMARARISEFESSQASHAVRSPPSPGAVAPPTRRDAFFEALPQRLIGRGSRARQDHRSGGRKVWPDSQGGEAVRSSGPAVHQSRADPQERAGARDGGWL